MCVVCCFVQFYDRVSQNEQMNFLFPPLFVMTLCFFSVRKYSPPLPVTVSNKGPPSLIFVNLAPLIPATTGILFLIWRVFCQLCGSSVIVKQSWSLINPIQSARIKFVLRLIFFLVGNMPLNFLTFLKLPLWSSRKQGEKLA